MAVTAAIWQILITSSVLIICIFGIRKLTMGKISMRLRYALWILAAVRLLTPVSAGASPVSVMNLFPQISQEEGFGRLSRADAVAGAAEGAAVQTVPSVSVSGTGENPAPEWKEQGTGITDAAGGRQKSQEDLSGRQAEKVTASLKRITPAQAAGAVWLTGFLITGATMLVFRFRFTGYLRRKRRALSAQEIPLGIREKLAARGLRAYRVKGLPSPCLVGRRIYLGERTPGGQRELAHILAHEYCHRTHGDGFWSFVRCALAAVYWFDPLVWAAAYAARQDSDLACDEAVVRLLGEEERFAYGRTLLALLQESGNRTACLGMPLMYSGSERSVRERIVSLTGRNKAEVVVLAAVFSLVFLVCGCAFTGAEDGTKTEETAAGAGTENTAEETDAAWQEGNGGRPANGEETQAAAEDADGKLSPEQIAELEESARQEAQQAAFEEALNYHSAMEGQDDEELSLNRQVDVQHFYEYNAGEREDAPGEGWYLLCRNEEEAVSFYGLYTEAFGCRGVKTLIGEDVNTFDLVWHPSTMNYAGENFRVLERGQDGQPRRFVWKYLEQESSDTEIWRLAGGFRYDTGTVELWVLPEEEYLPWADWHLTYGIDQESGQIRVYYDGSENALAGILDISAYRDFDVEEVQIRDDIVGFELNSEAFGEDTGEDYEQITIQLAPVLKLEGSEELWLYKLSPIAVQLLWNEEESRFYMGKPKVDERYQLNAPWQERKLEELRKDAAQNGRPGQE